MAKNGHPAVDSEGSIAPSLDALFEATSRELMAAYAEENLTYSGAYLTKIRALYDKQNADDAEYDAGRRVVNIAVSYFDVNDPTNKVGEGFIKTSPELRYTQSGKLDNACKRYAELAKAVGVSGQSTEETYEVAKSRMFMTKVREVYVVPESELHTTHLDARIGTNGDAWVTLEKDDSEARDHYLSIGLEPKVMVDRIYKVKG